MLRELFVPDHHRHEGVRPINIWGLRLFYALMAVFVASNAWMALLNHEGPWSPTGALAYCVWAAYPTLAILGVLHPLRMLPLMLFVILYKSLWFIFVAYPLWSTNTLAGSNVEAITNSFLALPLIILAVPWGYVWRTYVIGRNVGSVSSELRASASV